MQIWEIIKAAILGIIEGITEWLPISSTGHMILADEFIRLNVSDAFKEMFFVVIQLGAILAVLVLYFHKLNPFSPKKSAGEKKETFSLWGKVIVACIPAAVIGLLFDEKIDELFYNYITVAITLILYGVLFIVIENRNKSRAPKVNALADLSYQTALFIGMFQVLSLIPGTSRSGATILGAILIGTSRYVAAEFTFFLAIPVMFGASLLKIVKFGFDFSGSEIAILLTGMVVAFAVSVFAIKFLMGYIKKHDFKAFGWYRIALGVIVVGYFLLKQFVF
ncbi:undecaprenyl-diphosphate phosphatase [Fumia xinanensis]|uniref:Undecaprenyl-diphosphatase n=1 Tax=Fumia xinanensis TaxID=2763659 RepID=A0A926E5F3_9FIRM|nr:undecaprenyl-diphosphate phosphatase [Fumia xinanensis]MBC8560048.1 undecaprenyl-diphosphate phosphatase [Fumia xinanensis]